VRSSVIVISVLSLVLIVNNLSYGYDNFSLNNPSFAQKTMSAISIEPQDMVVDDDWNGLPAGTTVYFPNDPNGHVLGSDAFSTINSAYAASPAGTTMFVAPGMYNSGTLDITKSIRIIGSGSSSNPATGTVVINNVNSVIPPGAVSTGVCFIIQTSDVILSNMHCTTSVTGKYGQGVGNRIVVAGIANNLTLDNIHATKGLDNIIFRHTSKCFDIKIRNCKSDFAANSDLWFQSTGTTPATFYSCDISNLLIEGCTFTDSWYGILNYQPRLNNFPDMRPNDFRDVVIKNCRFERLELKGIYVERLQDALLDGLFMVDCGTTYRTKPLNPAVLYPAFTSPNAININLKFSDFSNVRIQNSNFVGCGTREGYNSACFYIEARADTNLTTTPPGDILPTNYSVNQATLTNLVIENCSIRDCTRAMVINHAKDVSVLGSIIKNCTKGITVSGIDNFLTDRCSILNNTRELLPFFDLSATYGIGIMGRFYPQPTEGPNFEPSGNVVVKNTLFCGNTFCGILNIDQSNDVAGKGFTPTIVDARSNWWGANDGPSGFGEGHGDPVNPGLITFDPWIVMNLSSPVSQINIGGQSTNVKASLGTLSDGTPLGSTVMDGIINITLTTTYGSFENGFQSVILPIVSGIAQTKLVSGYNIGLASITLFSECNLEYPITSTTIRIVGEIDLTVKKTARKSSLFEGEKASFVITVANRGNVPATNVVLSDIFPRELTFVSSSPSGASSQGKVLFEIGTLLPGQSTTFDLTFKLGDKTELGEQKLLLTNEAIVTGYNFYTGEKSVAKSSAIVNYQKPVPTPDMQIVAKWKGLDSKNNIIDAQAELMLDVSVEGCTYPCQINVDWGDRTANKRSLESSGFVSFSHSWSSGQYTVTIKAMDAYGKTKILTRTINVR
jgi:uncharacterized repeat protein (TIGR01451 family)